MKENLGLYCLCLVREFGSVSQNENRAFLLQNCKENICTLAFTNISDEIFY